MAKKIAVELDLDVIVRITDNHGGYLAGECIACGASGWIVERRHGFSHGSEDKWPAELHHKARCPVNKHLGLVRRWNGKKGIYAYESS